MKWYAVAVGRDMGIFTSWTEVSKYVTGYPGALYKSFTNKNDAETWLLTNTSFSNTKLCNTNQQNLLFNVNPSGIFTDGSCKDSVGGWSCVLVENNNIVNQIYGKVNEYPTTNNRAELYAILMAVTNFNKQCTKYGIFTDSEYSLKSLSQWMEKWKTNGWKTSNGNTPENLDLLCEIQKYMDGITINKVKAHSGHQWNELADQLANLGVSL